MNKIIQYVADEKKIGFLWTKQPTQKDKIRFLNKIIIR